MKNKFRCGNIQLASMIGAGLKIKKRTKAYRMPITPQATRPPAFPVFLESGWSERPKSSAFSWSTRPRPRMLWGPMREIRLSTKSMRPMRVSSNSTLPRSPTWRSSSLGWPCCFCNGIVSVLKLFVTFEQQKKFDAKSEQ